MAISPDEQDRIEVNPLNNPIADHSSTPPHWTRSRLFLGISLLAVLTATALDLIAPPLGVPITLLLIAVLLRLSGERFIDLGLHRPASWFKTFLLALVLAMLAQALAIWGIVPLLKLAGIPLPDASRFAEVRGNLPTLFFLLFIAWVPAGFGEEVIWRGFLMARLARLLGDGRGAWIASLWISSVIFGLLHAYQGPSGMALTGFAGLILGTIYLCSGRNLWLAIFTHALMDTLSFVAMYFGWLDRLLG